MTRWLALIGCLSLSSQALAIDASGNVTEITRSGHWQIIEFAAQRQLIYRISSDAKNSKEKHITFDFVPARKCEPTPALFITRQNSYNPVLDEGFVPLAYKLPEQKESMEITKTAMKQGDVFAFFQFQRLTTKSLIQSGDKGHLAIWIPQSGDGTVKRSENIYFSLEGFAHAYDKARQLCNDSR